jgi:PRC-barrel domain
LLESGGIIMPIYPVKDVDLNHRRPVYSRVHPHDLVRFEVYCGLDKVGSVEDLLIEDSGQLRYFVIRTGSWILGRQVLLPVGRTRIDDRTGQIYIDRLTRSQLKWVPEYQGLPVDANYEEQVRESYRSRKITARTVVASPRSQSAHRSAQSHQSTRSHRTVRPSYQLYDVAASAKAMPGSIPINHSADRSYTHSAIGFFSQQRDAEQTIAELRQAGFSQDQIALIAQRLELRPAEIGANLLHHLDYPRFSFPAKQVRQLTDRIDRGDYLLVVQGPLAQLQQARAILTRPRVSDFGIYPVSQTVSQSTGSDSLYQQPTDPMIALTVDAPQPSRQPRIEQADPQVKIIDRREQTRRSKR